MKIIYQAFCLYERMLLEPTWKWKKSDTGNNVIKRKM